jgi:GNAT superfamily N-acetyltransferase
MKIVEYDDVDPLEVLHLNLLCLGFALTPERAALIRRLDARPFPFFALYAIEDEAVVGQVGVFRLPMISMQGPEDVGGVWAVCTHPAFGHRGIAARLLDEAHARMREASLRFSTLGTSRYRVAHLLYRRKGYEDAFISASALARRETAQCETGLRAEQAGKDRLHLADDLFDQVATGRLGFARRHKSFIQALVEMGDVSANEVWLLWQGSELVGYALARVLEAVGVVSDLLLRDAIDTVQAVAAVVRQTTAPYVHVRANPPSGLASLQQAGYQLAQPDWGTFMIKPLIPEVTVEDARRNFGIGTDRFLISWMDTT